MLANGLGHLSALPLRSKLYGLALFCALSGLAAPMRLGIVQGNSMAPTLTSGQWYVLDRGHYRRNEVQRGDVILFRREGVTYVKRVLATGGDSVWVVEQEGGEDQLVPQWQLPKLRKLSAKPTWGRGIRLMERVVPSGHFYVVGDNLDESVDSRLFGTIPREAVRARVLTPTPPSPVLDEMAVRFRGAAFPHEG
jgi:signal peptidase I